MSTCATIQKSIEAKKEQDNRHNGSQEYRDFPAYQSLLLWKNIYCLMPPSIEGFNMGMFKFSAWGILAVAALLFVLYVGSKDTALFSVGTFIVIAFVLFMFVKLILGRRG